MQTNCQHFFAGIIPIPLKKAETIWLTVRICGTPSATLPCFWLRLHDFGLPGYFWKPHTTVVHQYGAINMKTDRPSAVSCVTFIYSFYVALLSFTVFWVTSEHTFSFEHRMLIDVDCPILTSWILGKGCFNHHQVDVLPPKSSVRCLGSWVYHMSTISQ